jgi:hypothetical protein
MKYVTSIIILVISLIPLPSHAGDDEWYLMSRHGTCSKIDCLERKVEDMTGIETPDEFIEFVRKKGYDVDVVRPRVLRGNALKVVVSEKNLSLLFVTKDLCKEIVEK